MHVLEPIKAVEKHRHGLQMDLTTCHDRSAPMPPDTASIQVRPGTAQTQSTSTEHRRPSSTPAAAPITSARAQAGGISIPEASVAPALPAAIASDNGALSFTTVTHTSPAPNASTNGGSSFTTATPASPAPTTSTNDGFIFTAATPTSPAPTTSTNGGCSFIAATPTSPSPFASKSGGFSFTAAAAACPAPNAPTNGGFSLTTATAASPAHIAKKSKYGLTFAEAIPAAPSVSFTSGAATASGSLPAAGRAPHARTYHSSSPKRSCIRALRLQPAPIRTPLPSVPRCTCPATQQGVTLPSFSAASSAGCTSCPSAAGTPGATSPLPHCGDPPVAEASSSRATQPPLAPPPPRPSFHEAAAHTQPASPSATPPTPVFPTAVTPISAVPPINIVTAATPAHPGASQLCPPAVTPLMFCTPPLSPPTTSFHPLMFDSPPPPAFTTASPAAISDSPAEAPFTHPVTAPTYSAHSSPSPPQVSSSPITCTNPPASPPAPPPAALSSSPLPPTPLFNDPCTLPPAPPLDIPSFTASFSAWCSGSQSSASSSPPPPAPSQIWPRPPATSQPWSNAPARGQSQSTFFWPSPPATSSHAGMPFSAGTRFVPFQRTCGPLDQHHEPGKQWLAHICAMPEYSCWAPEELRFQDYACSGASLPATSTHASMPFSAGTLFVPFQRTQCSPLDQYHEPGKQWLAHICAMPEYSCWAPEELRFQDYARSGAWSAGPTLKPPSQRSGPSAVGLGGAPVGPADGSLGVACQGTLHAGGAHHFSEEARGEYPRAQDVAEAAAAPAAPAFAAAATAVAAAGVASDVATCAPASTTADTVADAAMLPSSLATTGAAPGNVGVGVQPAAAAAFAAAAVAATAAAVERSAVVSPTTDSISGQAGAVAGTAERLMHNKALPTYSSWSPEALKLQNCAREAPQSLQPTPEAYRQPCQQSEPSTDALGGAPVAPAGGLLDCVAACIPAVVAHKSTRYGDDARPTEGAGLRQVHGMWVQAALEGRRWEEQLLRLLMWACVVLISMAMVPEIWQH